MFNQLKSGTKVSCFIRSEKIGDAKIQIEDGEYFICQNVRSGASCRNKLGYHNSWSIDHPTNEKELLIFLNSNGVTNLKIIGGSMDDLKVGDILIDGDGDERYVMGACGKIVWISEDGSEAELYDTTYPYTVIELKNLNYHLKGEEPEEMTMAEVCKELGRTIKIKK